ncbi:hypothetical protein O6H91_21G044600 [Diphasiastrum complanatum]|uniref:Uncharacterized protein n=1 Tax=Diphasiastrum complanatum TaxID=34168 RepID=A0ACC2AKA4_DIPCM|nr:hypothetical protein O6H91_21G044600 [Diphasiastrum complanatum]
MSFLHPDVGGSFHHVLQYFLWFQLFYSVWQFVRTAKFFRLPYVLLSSLWHGLDSWYKPRNLIIIKDVPTDPLPSREVSSEAIDEFNFKVSFNDGSENIYVADKMKACHMEMLNESFLKQHANFGVDDDFLWPGGHLIRRLDFYEAMDLVSSGKGYVTEPAISCFFDCSSKQVLNQNFLRFVSIWPLILQARHFDFWSALLSVVIILLDVFSFWANKGWEFVQYWLSRFVKWIIARFPNPDTRVFFHTFMSTISTQYDCSNFVTNEASVKVMTKVLIMSNIRVNKHKIQAFQPVPCICGPWKKNSDEFSLHGVEYRILVQGDFWSGGNGTVTVTDKGPASNGTLKVKRPTHPFVKVGGWNTADMAYFYGVCKVCDEFGVPPIKSLDARNGHCCSLQELMQGVKERKFILCVFKKEEQMFIS